MCVWHRSFLSNRTTWLTPLEHFARGEAAIQLFRDRLEISSSTAEEDRLPYAVDVVALDQQGIVYNLADFFSSRDIEIADVATRSYSAAHTGAPMFAVQMAVNVPSSQNIAHLREEFLEVCDRLNLDAILEPVKA